MGLKELFRKVPSVAAAELRERAEGGGEEVLLLDVREPAEYAGGHLPGARHIPLSRLADRLGELNPSRPVVTY